MSDSGGRGADDPVEGSPPFRRGPVGAVLAWAERLPGGGWWAFVLFGVALFAWGQGIEWAVGQMPVGTLDQTLLTGTPYGPFGLITIGLGLRIARGSLRAFWPATGWPEAERPAWEQRFAALPRGLEIAALLVGAAAAVASLVAARAAVGATAGHSTAVFVAYLPAFVAGYAMSAVGGLLTIRWLVLVTRIHREATAVDIFDRVPIYAFSRLTVVVGITYLAVAYYSITVNAAAQADNPTSIAFIGSTMLFAVASFIVPLWGIHRRLVEEKEELLRGVEGRVGRLGEELYRRVDAGQYDQTKAVSDSIAGVSALRDRIARLPTWPWPPNVLRGFVTALLLPVIVYVASRLIGGNLGV